MSIEREFIKELLNEIEIKEELVRDKEKDNGNLRGKVVELTQNNDELKNEAEELRKEIDHLKTKVKKPFTTKITNPTTLNIFEAMKEGEVISFLKPTDNKSYKTFKENPFVFTLENKGAIYCGELLGMFEIKGDNIHYYYENKPGRIIGGEIARQILHIDEETLNCSYRSFGSRKGKKMTELTYHKILKTNPIINTELNKFVSGNGNRYIYTKNDGSKYILLENGEEEVI